MASLNCSRAVRFASGINSEMRPLCVRSLNGDRRIVAARPDFLGRRLDFPVGDYDTSLKLGRTVAELARASQPYASDMRRALDKMRDEWLNNR